MKKYLVYVNGQVFSGQFNASEVGWIIANGAVTSNRSLADRYDINEAHRKSSMWNRALNTTGHSVEEE